MSSLVVIGNFDGVHRGHQEVLAEARRVADARALEVALLSFVPHPRAALGGTAPPLLTTLARKEELVRRIDPRARFVLHPFDRAYASQSPAAFAERLAREEGAKVVMVGRNFRFGKDRAGDVAELGRLGAELGFEPRCLELTADAVGPFSSTRARAAIARGDLEDAERVLGRPHMLSGVVVHGKKLGRTIGFPTVNLEPVPEVLPALGIYAVLVDRLVDGRPRALARGAMNVGTNPTTDGDSRVKVEVFLFDLDEDLYGEELRVHVVRRLRDERRFDGLDALITQMNVDVADAREATRGCAPDAAHGAFG